MALSSAYKLIILHQQISHIKLLLLQVSVCLICLSCLKIICYGLKAIFAKIPLS